jgi:N-acetylglutamate synthase-like GNAT family acetyltransferase
MIFSFGGGTQLRPMERSDFGAVLRIISSHDDDDFEEAREELRDDFEDMFVLTAHGKVVAVTGAPAAPHSEDVVWLSWPHVDVARQGNGLRRTMAEELLEMLRADGMRKLFINTGDNREDAEDTYAAARAFYDKWAPAWKSHCPPVTQIASPASPTASTLPARLLATNTPPAAPCASSISSPCPKVKAALALSGKKSRTPPRVYRLEASQ